MPELPSVNVADAIHRQGNEWLVAFSYHNKRYNLGHFQTRREADHALTRKVAALEVAAATRDLQPAPRAAPRPARVKDGCVAAEARLPVELLARLVRYDVLTGGMTPRPRFHGRGRYLSLEVAGARVYAHRVAWALVNGAWPQRRLRCLGREVDLRAANWREAGDAEHA